MLFSCGHRVPGRDRLRERRFPVLQGQDLNVLVHRCQRIVLRLKPYQLGFEIPDTSLKTSHLRDHPGVGPADVAE